ncbi:MAG TPA: hypothetical protein VME23_11225 [Terracidiphilus sp.]|nr:hypothetical protein [Terracidiphilus sp.]
MKATRRGNGREVGKQRIDSLIVAHQEWFKQNACFGARRNANPGQKQSENLLFQRFCQLLRKQMTMIKALLSATSSKQPAQKTEMKGRVAVFFSRRKAPVRHRPKR